jgi:hypothetical protein
MGLQTGDAITLVSEVETANPGVGKLIIRKAKPGEVALILPDLPPIVTEADGATSPFCGENCVYVGASDMVGPQFEWCFPPEWVELFFPGTYDADNHDFNSQTEWSWWLSNILGQSEEVELKMASKGLFLYLQRRGLSPSKLTLHLVPGLLRLLNWTTESELVLASESGFNPFGEEDTLTIREPFLGEEPNLLFSAGFWHCDVNPLWFDRYFPDIYDPQDDDRPYIPDECYNQSFDTDERDTLLIGPLALARTKHSLGFEIGLPRGVL